MPSTYKHTQVGYTTLACLAVGLAVSLPLSGSPPERPIALTVAVLMAVFAILFGTLTIEVGDGRLRWHFGPGLIRSSALVFDVREVVCVRTRVWEGWGIHHTSRGWLYNVSGFGAVQVFLASGRTFLLGSDEPEVLAEALRRAVAGGSA